MPLSVALPTLKTALADAMGKGDVSDTTAKANIQTMADDMGDAIHAYVTSALVLSNGPTSAHIAGCAGTTVSLLPGTLT